MRKCAHTTYRYLERLLLTLINLVVERSTLSLVRLVQRIRLRDWRERRESESIERGVDKVDKRKRYQTI